MRERMRASRRDLQSSFARELGQLAPKIDNVIARAFDIVANLGAKLDHRLVHLRLDLFLEQNFAALENFLNVRAQLARLRIDNGELLLDSEGVSVFLLHSAERKTSADFAYLHRLFQNRARSSLICENLRNLWTNFSRIRLTNAWSRPPEEIFPSSNCRGLQHVRALCGWPFRKWPRRPTRNLPDRLTPLRRPAPDCKNRSPLGRRHESRTPPCSNRNREIHSIAARLPRLSPKFPSARSIRFDNADETDGAARRA